MLVGCMLGFGVCCLCLLVLILVCLSFASLGVFMCLFDLQSCLDCLPFSLDVLF